ncbi:MAG: DUF1800 family protein [Lysobacterales bacterium]
MNRSSSRRRFIRGSAAAAVATTAGASVAQTSVAQTTPGRTVELKPLAREINALSSKAGSDNTLTPPFEVRVLHKMGFGPARRERKAGVSSGPGNSDVIFSGGFEPPPGGGGVGKFGDLGKDDVGYFLSLGASDDERLENYVDEQLNPDTIDDSDFDARMAPFADDFPTLDESRVTSFTTRECNGDQNIYLRPYRDVRNMAFNRATYSNKQLQELMVDFWHNHFNVFVRGNRDIEVGWGSWDRDIMRTYTMGNFADMCVAVGKHPVMLRYLDNYVNSAGGINENYARELFELHCLGAENYGGVERPFTGFELLPENPYVAINNYDMGNFANSSVQIAAQYYDDDVYEAAAGLTGWRYGQNSNRNPPCDDGVFEVDLGAHDETGKSLLSTASNLISANTEPEREGELIIRVAAYHPGTATYVARKLCTRLIADNPPESIVQAAAAEFFAFRESPNQIKRTLRVILLSDEFKNAWGQKTKRPFEYMISAMRAAGSQQVVREDNTDSRDFHWQFDDTRQELFHWSTPDGYPDNREHWQGSTSLVQTWQNIDWILDRNAGDDDRWMRISDIVRENLAGDFTPRGLAEFWCEWIMGYTPPGGWVGNSIGYQDANTDLGGFTMQFMTQVDLPNPDNRPHFYLYDQSIPRLDLFEDDYPYYWRRRLIGMVDLILWSPTFIQR